MEALEKGTWPDSRSRNFAGGFLAQQSTTMMKTTALMRQALSRLAETQIALVPPFLALPHDHHGRLVSHAFSCLPIWFSSLRSSLQLHGLPFFGKRHDRGRGSRSLHLDIRTPHIENEAQDVLLANRQAMRERMSGISGKGNAKERVSRN